MDRKRLYVHIASLGTHRKSIDSIDTCIDKLMPSHAKSITFGKEKKFTKQKRLSQHNIDVYFADADCSNQQARNEKADGLIRQYLPKRTAIDQLTSQQTDKIASDLKLRPRK